MVFYIRLAQNLDSNIFLLKLIPMTYIPIGLLFLNFVYHLVSRKRDALLWMFSFLVLVSLLTNAFTDIFVTKFIKSAWGYHLESSHPLSFYFLVISIFLPTLLGLFFLFKEIYQNQDSPFKKQIKLILGGTTFIWFIVLLSEYTIFSFEMYENIRFGPISVAIVALFILPAIVKYNFITPSKREISTKLFTSLPDAVFLLNEAGIIIESNKAAKNIIESTNLSHLSELSADYLFLNYSHENNYSEHITKLLFNQAKSISISQSDYKEFGFKMGKLLIVKDVSTILLSEQQLKQAQEVSHTGSFQYDLITEVVTWSEELYRIYGKDPKVYNPTNSNFLSEIVHPEDKKRIESLVEENLYSTKPFEYNHRIILSNNQERVMHCKCIVTLNDENVPICIDGTAQDITELEKTQSDLIKSEEKYRSLFDNSPDPIVIHDASTIYYCNSAAVKLSGLNSIDELESLKINDFFSEKYLEDAQKNILNYIEGNHVKLNRQEIILPGSSLFIEARGVRTKFEGKPAIQSSIRDVTPRVLAEKQLVESEERYRNAIENSTDIIYNTDLDGNITFVNAVFESISGYTETEVLGRDVNILVAPSHQEMIKNIYYDFFQSPDKNFITTVLAQPKSGEDVWLELNISKIQEGKFVLGFTAIARDITLRKKIENALAESEEKYRLLVENSTEMIYKIDLQGNYTFVNQVVIENLGYTEEALLSMNCFENIVKEHHDDVRAFYTKQIKTKKPIVFYELPYFGKDEKVYWLSQMSRLNLDENGIPIGFSISARDVTEKHNAEIELMNSEERYRKLIEASPDGIIIYNLENGILFANNSALKIARATSKDQLIGKSPMEFVDVSNLELVQSRIERILKGEDMDYHHEIFVRVDGSKVDAEAKGVLITFNNKPAIQTTIRDISDRMRAEKILIESEKRYKELYENAPAAYLSISTKGTIISCNNMITQILGYKVSEIIDKPVIKLYADNDFGKPRAKKVFEKFKVGQSTVNEELEMVKKDGTPCWVSLTVFPVKNEDGEIIETRSMVVDINERKIIQREFESNRLQMLQAQNIAQLGSWEWDMIVNTVSWSENLYSLYGTDRNTFQATFEGFMSRVHPDDQEYVTNTITECAKTQIPMDYYHRTIPINGQVHTMHCNGIVIADEEGIPLTMVGTAQDVTKTVEADRALKESEKRLANAQSIAHLGHWQENHKTGELFYSDEGKRILGLDIESEVKQGDFWKVVHPEEVEEFKLKWKKIEQKMEPYEGTYRVLLKNGEVRHIQARVKFQKDKHGKLELTLGTDQDITELVEANIQLENSQKRLKQAQQLALIGNWEFDATTGKTYWSDECKRLFGFETDLEVENKAYWAKIHPDDHDWLLDLWKESKISLKPYKVVYQATIDNQIKYLRESTEFTAHQDGKVYRCLGTIQDITTEKNAEQEIKDSHDRLRGLSKHLQTIQEDERAHIAREIHDELGQRLTGIKMDLSWIGNKIPQDNKTVFERINSLNLLIDDTVQSVRKISSELHPAILDDLGLKAAMEWQVSEFIRRTNTKCDLVMNEDDFEFDASQEKALFRIMQESLTNIMRHANAKKVSVLLEKTQDGINFSIRDNGIGIDNYDEKTHSSFGILSMQERAYSLGGVLTISSKLNEGTNINLFIPTQLEQS